MVGSLRCLWWAKTILDKFGVALDVMPVVGVPRVAGRSTGEFLDDEEGCGFGAGTHFMP